MNKYQYLLIAILAIGCASKNTTVNANTYGEEKDASFEDSDAVESSAVDVKEPDVTYNDASPDIEIECLPGGEVVGNSCYYPEPECCSYTDCPQPNVDYSCIGGRCIKYTLPKECKNESCQQYCVNCWVPGDKNYNGTCNGTSCECEK